MKELIKYLIENMVIDFQGEITLETVRGFLREDDGREARQLLAKLIEELTVKLERSPTIAELAKAAGATEEEVLEALETG